MAKTQDTALAELAELGAALGAAVDDTEKKSHTLKQILDTIGELDPDDAKALFKNEKVQRLIEIATAERAEASDDPPGTVYDGIVGGVVVRGLMKKPWNEADLTRLIEKGEMQLVRNYRPPVTKHVIWNGLGRWFVARRPITCPECFVYVYEQSLDAAELAEQHADYLFKRGAYKDSTGRLADPGMITAGGAKARATGEGGYYQPGGGMVHMGERAEQE